MCIHVCIYTYNIYIYIYIIHTYIYGIRSLNSPEETLNPRRDSEKTGRRHRSRLIVYVASPCFLGVSSWVWSLFWGILGSYMYETCTCTMSHETIRYHDILWYGIMRCNTIQHNVTIRDSQTRCRCDATHALTYP